MRPVTPVVRIGRHAAGAAITAGLLVGGSSVALADGQAPAGAESAGVTATPQTAPAVAIPSAGATASPTAYGAGIESAAANLSIKAKPVEKPKPVEKTAEKASDSSDEDSAVASRGTSRSAAEDDDTSSSSDTSSQKKSSRSESSDEDSSSTTSSSTKSSSKKSSTESTSEESSDDAPAAATSGSSIVDTARSGIGVRYVYGGSSRSGWDCSGFTSWVYAQHGISLPHSASGQKAQGTVISKSEARPGDLVYTPGHVGIYAGNGTIIDAGNSAKDTTERKMWSASWTYVRVA